MNLLENIMELIEHFIIQIYDYLYNEADDFEEESCNCSLCKK